MDQTIPVIKDVIWETYQPVIQKVIWEIYQDPPLFGDWYVKFTCEAFDVMSGMNRVEMYIDDEHYETIVGPGPIYEFEIKWLSEYRNVIFWFYHFDNAGNVAIDVVDSTYIISYPYSQSQQQQSNPLSKPTYQH